MPRVELSFYNGGIGKIEVYGADVAECAAMLDATLLRLGIRLEFSHVEPTIIKKEYRAKGEFGARFECQLCFTKRFSGLAEPEQKSQSMQCERCKKPTLHKYECLVEEFKVEEQSK